MITNFGELEKEIEKIEKSYGFSIIIEKEKEDSSFIGISVTMNPIRKHYDKEKISFLADCFEKYWECKKEIISSEYGNAYLLFREKLK